MSFFVHIPRFCPHIFLSRQVGNQEGKILLLFRLRLLQHCSSTFFFGTCTSFSYIVSSVPFILGARPRTSSHCCSCSPLSRAPSIVSAQMLGYQSNSSRSHQAILCASGSVVVDGFSRQKKSQAGIAPNRTCWQQKRDR